MPSVSQFGDSWYTNPERLDVASLHLVGSHGAAPHPVQGPWSCMTHFSFTQSSQLKFCIVLPFRWFSWCMWDACVPLRCRDVALPLPVQSPVEFRYSLLHMALSLCPQSFRSLILQPWSSNSLFPQPWSPNCLPLQPHFAAPLLREFAAYLASGRPSVVTAAGIYGELFNSSQIVTNCLEAVY